MTYRRSWNLFLAWKPLLSLPISVVDVHVCNFIDQLFIDNYSPSTIFPHISAISYVHKIFNLPDPTQAFVTKTILKGCQAHSQRKDTRLPITVPILQKLLSALEHTVSQYPIKLLYHAVFLLAFHGFLRLGEITVKYLKSKHQVLQRSDVTFNQSS